jgi:hypothetical protein
MIVSIGIHEAYCTMQKGDVYELSHWFEGENSDWVIFVAHDEFDDNSFMEGNEFRLLGNIFSIDLGSIPENLEHCTVEDLRDTILEMCQEEYWDDDDALQRMHMLLDYLGVTVEEEALATA